MNYNISNYECQEITNKGKKCCYKAKHNYENKLLCSKHLKTNKSKEDCPICFEPMTHKKVDACGNSHYYHIDCLSKCNKYGECPTCKNVISNTTSIKINEEADNYRKKCLYLLPPKTHLSINLLLDIIIQNAYINETIIKETNILSECIMDFYNISNINQRNNILTSLYYIVNCIKKNNSVNNINISIRDNQVFFN
jgi:hypothetical protein